jgi:hypothetical protein
VAGAIVAAMVGLVVAGAWVGVIDVGLGEAAVEHAAAARATATSERESERFICVRPQLWCGRSVAG